MHINLPNGDVLVPDSEFLAQAGGVTYRTGRNWDVAGCPYVHVGGRKYRPLQEALTWLASHIKRLNQPRRTRRSTSTIAPTAP
jgi:hypothetical protein